MSSPSGTIGIAILVATAAAAGVWWLQDSPRSVAEITIGEVLVHDSPTHDESPALGHIALSYVNPSTRDGGIDGGSRPANAVAPPLEEEEREELEAAARRRDDTPIVMRSPRGADAVEQTKEGTKPAARMDVSFEGPGASFVGPQGNGRGSNPSDHSLAVGPDHVVAIVNGGGVHIWTKKGKLFDTTGRVLLGPVNVRAVWKGFGGQCDTRGSGDAVVRYDQLANRWLVVVPLFSAYPHVDGQQPTPTGRRNEGSVVSWRGQTGQPGSAVALEPLPPPDPNAQPAGGRRGAVPAVADTSGRGNAAARGGAGDTSGRGRAGAGRAGAGRAATVDTTPPRMRGAPPPVNPNAGVYGMCYAVSTTSDPLGTYYRYEFVRPLFPDYPRPAIWPDGYYIPTSTSDNFIQKHACVADRAKMLKGEDATEQCLIIDGIPFLNNVDLDGKELPPPGAPNTVLAAGGSQLREIFEDSVIMAWSFHVDWKDPRNTKLAGPVSIPVAPYHFLCNGQLTRCIPQPGSNTRLDSQGDKLMARVTYRRIGNVEHIVATHSINTAAGGGGVRWYEFRVGKNRAIELFQQGTYALTGPADTSYRWLPSAAMDKFGNIGIGYSFGGLPYHAGQRFAGREPNDPKGMLTMAETVMVDGAGSQQQTRWEDYTQTAVDPTDDCTIWYIGDYVKAGATTPSSRIGAFKMKGCR